MFNTVTGLLKTHITTQNLLCQATTGPRKLERGYTLWLKAPYGTGGMKLELQRSLGSLFQSGHRSVGRGSARAEGADAIRQVSTRDVARSLNAARAASAAAAAVAAAAAAVTAFVSATKATAEVAMRLSQRANTRGRGKSRKHCHRPGRHIFHEGNRHRR